MDKKMTSGEIAKKVGISQKAVRLYDEKGLLNPTEYSEGNYRLYDKEAILVLEKIIALKHIGFTLEEIYDNLIAGKNMNIVESLNEQLAIMEIMCAEQEYNMTEEAKQYVLQQFCNKYETKDENFANARDVRNFLEHAITKQATRLIQISNPTKEQLLTLEMVDFQVG